jgi:hypothetical protein
MSTTDNRPLYVRRLDAERRQAQAELGALQEGLNELRAYLTSAKFAPPCATVNPQDVLLRLNESSYAALLAGERAM